MGVCMHIPAGQWTERKKERISAIFVEQRPCDLKKTFKKVVNQAWDGYLPRT